MFKSGEHGSKSITFILLSYKKVMLQETNEFFNYLFGE